MSTPNLPNAFNKQPNEILEVMLTFLEFKDVTRFRMTSRDYYNGLRMTFTEEHRNTVERKWIKIYNCGGVDYVRRIFAQDDKIEPSKNLFEWACYQFTNWHKKYTTEDERTELFYFLWKDLNMDPSYNFDMAIKYASVYNCINLVKDLLKDGRVNPSADEDYAIRIASRYGYENVVKELLKDARVDPSADHDYAIRIESKNGHVNVVEELLKDDRVNSLAINDYTLSYKRLRPLEWGGRDT
jgi:hypothetical protein